MAKMEERIIYLITTEGKEVEVNYRWDDTDDEILEELQNALRNNDVYFEDWADFEMKLGGNTMMELDFKKIIGIRW